MGFYRGFLFCWNCGVNYRWVMSAESIDSFILPWFEALCPVKMNSKGAQQSYFYTILVPINMISVC